MKFRYLSCIGAVFGLVACNAGPPGEPIASSVQALSDADGFLAFSTLTTLPFAIEGLTSDNAGNLYTPDRRAATAIDQPCTVWRVRASGGAPVAVGFIQPPAGGHCDPRGLAFNRSGSLFIADGDRIYSLLPSVSSPPTATLFASGVPIANGIAFDPRGTLWVSDGSTGLGRVWAISTAGVVTEMFRVQPMRNGADRGGILPGSGVGREADDVQSDGTKTAQDLVANGLAFSADGRTLFVADTARGAIWRVQLQRDGSIASAMGCDETFAADTLCLSDIWVQHALLEGADGIALDVLGNVWVDANERQSIVVVLPNLQVTEIFRNQPDPSTHLRNTGPLEIPTSPVLLGRQFCTANSDLARRDNHPASAGEIGGPGEPLGKISCLTSRLLVPGLPLPR